MAVKLSDEELRKRAIRILANLIHYTSRTGARNHYSEDVETLIAELRKVEADAATVRS